MESLTRVTLSETFERFRKMVFDLSHDLGKPVHDLEVTGAELDVDATLAEKLRDVLIHALRNCLDHGLEAADVRAAANKPVKGRVAVACRQEDGRLTFEVSDDGAGIDLDRVRAKALTAGLATEDELDVMTDDALHDLIFSPGLSTAKAVTDVSGRGVGMDVIRSTMRELNGDATITSRRGEGSTLTLWVPSGGGAA